MSPVPFEGLLTGLVEQGAGRLLVVGLRQHRLATDIAQGMGLRVARARIKIRIARVAAHEGAASWLFVPGEGGDSPWQQERQSREGADVQSRHRELRTRKPTQPAAGAGGMLANEPRSGNAIKIQPMNQNKSFEIYFENPGPDALAVALRLSLTGVVGGHILEVAARFSVSKCF